MKKENAVASLISRFPSWCFDLDLKYVLDFVEKKKKERKKHSFDRAVLFTRIIFHFPFNIQLAVPPWQQYTTEN